MGSIKLGRFLVLLIGLASCRVMAVPTISGVTDNLSSYSGGAVPKYAKYELTFSITGVGTAFTDYNPFNPNTTSLGSQYYNLKGILVDGILTTPSGTTVTRPAFWYDSGVWKLRVAPDVPGTWKVKIKATDSSGTGYSTERTFTVSSTAANHGPVMINPKDTRFFQYADGTPYYPIGCDMSGYTGTTGTTAWGTSFPKMAANGANFTRIFFTSYNIEQYCVGTDKSTPKALNNYGMSRAKSIDDIFTLAEQYGIAVEWLLDDWTYLKDTSNQYIKTTGRDAPCSTVEEFFTSTAAKEIYKRKLRYWCARWGYSSSLLAIELVNELGGGGSGTTPWHIEMGNYIHSYGVLATSSNGSGELRTGGGIPFNDPALDMVNYHDYAKYSGGWTVKSNYNCETLGSTLQFPWENAAVWADRVARIQFKRYGWKKPLLWSEYGLIYRKPGDSGFPDWTTAYQLDTSAKHINDAIWAGMLNGMAVAHWKLDYVLGKYGGGEKFTVYKPLSSYMKGEDFTGLTQETTYPVSDPVNPSPKVTSSNGNLMVVSMHGQTKAYLYVKNLTDTWFRNYYYGQTADRYADASKIPTPANQSGTIKVMGMTPGQYSLEKWSTTDTQNTTQLLSKTALTVGSDGVATISVSGLQADVAYKIKSDTTTPPPSTSPNVVIKLTSDKYRAAPGETVTYTITYTNTGTGTATNVKVSAPVPTNMTYVSATSGGTYSSSTRKVSWTVASVAAGATGKVTFQAKVN